MHEKIRDFKVLIFEKRDILYLGLHKY